MKKYHIHVYKIVSMAEVDIEATNKIEAKEKALSFKNELKYGESDCSFIAVDTQ